MKRRTFLVFISALGLSSYVQAKENSHFEKQFKTVEDIISAVQEHFFPEESKIPSAESMNLTRFLFHTVSHKSYDRDIRAFVIEGAKELQKREKTFLFLSSQEKEISLRAYEETGYGSNWLSRIMILSMEGLFSDPIYGANIKEGGWKALNAYGGFPKPKTRYIDV